MEVKEEENITTNNTEENNIIETTSENDTVETTSIENKETKINKEFKPLNESQNNQKEKSDVLIIFGILCSIFILLTIIIFCTFSLINIKSTTIAKGVYIKNIDVSGLTKSEATQKISAYINSVIPEEIKLIHNDFETSLSTSQLSIYFNTEEAVDIAYNIGKKGNIFQRNLTILEALFSKTNIDPGFAIDEEQLKNDLSDISSKLPDKVIESSCYIDGNNLVITKGKSGQIIKINESANYIKQQINALNFLILYQAVW